MVRAQELQPFALLSKKLAGLVRFSRLRRTAFVNTHRSETRIAAQVTCVSDNSANLAFKFQLHVEFERSFRNFQKVAGFSWAWVTRTTMKTHEDRSSGT